MFSGMAVWFLAIFAAALVVGVVAAILIKRFARPSEGNTEGGDQPEKVTLWLLLARLGLAFSILALLAAIYMLPVSLYLPEDISIPTFVYSLLAFPILLGLGVVLSFLSYIAKRYRSGLAGMVIGGLSPVWLVASYFVRMSAFD